jgi:uncharacterized integral membrane protein
MVLLVLAAAFIAQNRERISVDVFRIQLRTPMWLILVLAVAIGVVIGSVGARRRNRSVQGSVSSARDACHGWAAGSAVGTGRWCR